jgi:TolB-like protein
MFETAAPEQLLSVHGKKVATQVMPRRISVVAGHSHPESRSRGTQLDGNISNSTLVLNQVVDQVIDQSDTLAPPKTAIRQQLARIVQSTVFIQSERMSRFLRFIVEHALDGNQSYLKEYVIGTEVYDRRPPYNPSQDSIVRTEARRLRGKLKEYYEAEDKEDLVHIYLSPGSYVPTFQQKKGLTCTPKIAEKSEHFLSSKTSVIAIAILPFRDISGSLLSSTFARGIPDELAYTLMRTKGCKVISPASMEHFSAREQDVAAAMSKVGAQIAFEGSVRQEGNHIRVTARIVDAAGFQLWAKRFDADADSQTLFTIEEQIASGLSQGFDVLFGDSQRLSVV